MSLPLQSLVIFAVVCASLLVNSNSHRNGDSGYKNESCGHDPNSFDPLMNLAPAVRGALRGGALYGRNSVIDFWARRARRNISLKSVLSSGTE